MSVIEKASNSMRVACFCSLKIILVAEYCVGTAYAVDTCRDDTACVACTFTAGEDAADITLEVFVTRDSDRG